MTAQELIETVKQLKGYKVVSVDFEVNTFTTEKGSIYSFDITKTGLLKSNSIRFMTTTTGFANCSY